MSDSQQTGLDERARAIIAYVVKDLDADAVETIRAQVDAAIVVRAEQRMIDVEVPEGLPLLAIPNGPVPGTVLVSNAAGETTGEVLVWVNGGRLIGIEQAWYTDEAPTTWPDVAQLRHL